MTEVNRPERILAARKAFDAIIHSIVKQHGFEEKLDRVVLVGFSQGTIMALDAVASGRWPIAAVVGFSGRLASPEPINPTLSTRVLLIHGASDTVISSIETTRSAATLTNFGISVYAVVQPGVQHTTSERGAQLAAEFIAGLNR